MNRIILIGNGFDLAHGLPTSYRHFMDWYWEQRFLGLPKDSYESSDRLCTLKIFGNKRWGNFVKEYPHLSGKEFLDLIQKGRESRTYELVASPFFLNIIEAIETKGWVDIEYEYYKRLKIYLPNESRKEAKPPKELNKELHTIKELLVEYLIQVQDTSLNEYNNIAPEICRIIDDPISIRDISITDYSRNYELREVKRNNSPNLIMFLNFNYTRTADVRSGLASESKIIVNHIHGVLANPDSMIFGYGDELDRDFKSLLETNNNDFLEEVKSVRYLESDCYRKMLDFIETNFYQIYVMGHSCGISDRTLLNTLFEHSNCVSIKPFYYQSNDGKDNYSEIVQNIYRNFSNQKQFRDRVVNKKYCIPLPQSK